MTGLIAVVAVPFGLFFAVLAAVNHRHQIPEVAREISEWWRRRRHPRPVASFDSPTPLDEARWAATLPITHLRREARAIDRVKRRGRLVGERIVRARVLRAELKRRLEASERPNRAPMDHLSESEVGWVRRHLARKTRDL